MEIVCNCQKCKPDREEPLYSVNVPVVFGKPFLKSMFGDGPHEFTFTSPDKDLIDSIAECILAKEAK